MCTPPSSHHSPLLVSTTRMAAAAAAAMACLATPSLVPRLTSSTLCSTSTSPSPSEKIGKCPIQLLSKPRVRGSVAVKAGKSGGVEPDLEEDYRDLNETAGYEMEVDGTFPWGKADGAHSWHEGDDGTWWEGIKEVFESSGGPVGAQGAISWLFLPGLVAGVYFDINQDYLFLYTLLFIFAFIGMEMKKPSKPCHFEPDMYKLKK